MCAPGEWGGEADAAGRGALQVGAVGEDAEHSLEELAVAHHDGRARLVDACGVRASSSVSLRPSRASVCSSRQIRNALWIGWIRRRGDRQRTEGHALIAEGGVDCDDDRVLPEAGERGHLRAWGSEVPRREPTCRIDDDSRSSHRTSQSALVSA